MSRLTFGTLLTSNRRSHIQTTLCDSATARAPAPLVTETCVATYLTGLRSIGAVRLMLGANWLSIRTAPFAAIAF